MPVVAGAAAVVAAVMALLICYGALYFGRGIANMFPKSIGLPGLTVSIPIRSIITAAVDSALAGIQWVFGKWVRPAIAFVARPVLSFLVWIQSLLRFTITAAVQLQWLTFTALPRVLHVAKAYAATLYHRALSYAHRLYASAVAVAHTLYSRALNYAHRLYVSATAYAHRLYAAARAYAHAIMAAEATRLFHSIGLARHYASDLVRAARSDLGKAIRVVEAEVAAVKAVDKGLISTAIAAATKAIEADTTAIVATGIKDLTTDVDNAVARVFDGLIIDVGALEGVIATDLPDIGAAVRAIPRAIPTDIAGAIGLSLAIERVAVRYMKDCGVPNCRRLGGLGRFLEDLLDVGSLGLLLAMLTKIVEDPEGAAQETVDDLSGILGSATDLVSNLLGV